MPRLTPELEAIYRNSTVSYVKDLFDEIDALRHDAKSFTRNFEFLNDELKESEEKNKKLSKAVGAARDLLHVLRRTDAFSVDEIAESVIDLEEELDGEK